MTNGMLLGALALILGLGETGNPIVPRLSAVLDGAHATFRVEPVEPRALNNPAVSSVHVACEDDRASEPPPLLGTYAVDKEARAIVFTARFPAEPGVTYAAEYRAPDAQPIRQTFALSARALGPHATITRVSPSGDVLPENLLKFYIEFSAPMGRGESYEHIHLLDDRGKPLDLPFLELGEELWDPTGTRFTLFFDPGRIKKGLK